MPIARLSRLFSRPFSAALEPETPFQAVGDIHGRDDLLQSLLSTLDPSKPVVFVGDYIDRGEHSAQVLRRLHHLDTTKSNVICLKGNHEELLLDFLDAPEMCGERWLRNGGLQTLTSFEMDIGKKRDTTEAWDELRNALRTAIGSELESWLRDLPTQWASGNMLVVHAGADPRVPPDDQDPHCLTWGHRDFGHIARSDGIWVVHGHTIVEAPQQQNGVISIDTGAYATGKLTAVLVEDGNACFLST